MQTLWVPMLQDFENKDSQSLCHAQRLQQKVVELQSALETATSTADTRCRSVSAQMQMQLDSLTAEHQSVQSSLKAQIASLQQHIDSTTQQLQLTHSKLEHEKSARAEETQSFHEELEKRKQLAVVVDSKAESDSNVLRSQEHELQVLHHQVLYNSSCVHDSQHWRRFPFQSMRDLQIDDLTGINQQLQLELHEAESTGEQLKQELFSSVRRMAVKDYESEQVIKVAENSTVRSTSVGTGWLNLNRRTLYSTLLDVVDLIILRILLYSRSARFSVTDEAAGESKFWCRPRCKGSMGW